ncbi:unnamed protein product [Owenia fusiformis]|uniref:WD repeat-containing protein 91 n=1 Tax=Owenia fusiformis TaxID=6347 RepID=A0A8J1XGZ5_OWEFU|nr:unnamed protein product [Owenia fusiformis]
MDRMLLLGNKAGNIRLFDIKEKKTIQEVASDPAFPRVVSLACNQSGSVFVCSSNSKLRVPSGGNIDPLPRSGRLDLWDMKTMKLETHLPIGDQDTAINCTVFNHNGHLLLTGGADGKIRLFDVTKCECIADWEAHEGEVYSVQFSSDENSCYSMGNDGKFIEWSMNITGRKVEELNIHPGATGPFELPAYGGYKQVQTPKGKLFAFDSEGQYVLTCQQNGGLIYKMEGKQLSRSLSLGGHKAPVVCVDWASAIDCRTCLTGSMDGKVRASTLLRQ